MIKLDLGSGEYLRDGFESVDLFMPDAIHKVNLFMFPWPWEDSSIDELHCSHFIEHIPMTWVTSRTSNLGDKYDEHSHIPLNSESRDLFCMFFNEAYRILKPGGLFTVVWPALQSTRAFQDPTHRRFIPTEALLYLSAKWRLDNKIGHYLCSCNFNVETCEMSIPQHLVEASKQDVITCWNIVENYMATLKAVK